MVASNHKSRIFTDYKWRRCSKIGKICKPGIVDGVGVVDVTDDGTVLVTVVVEPGKRKM